jgi:hypothetical protein
VEDRPPPLEGDRHHRTPTSASVRRPAPSLRFGLLTVLHRRSGGVSSHGYLSSRGGVPGRVTVLGGLQRDVSCVQHLQVMSIVALTPRTDEKTDPAAYPHLDVYPAVASAEEAPSWIGFDVVYPVFRICQPLRLVSINLPF